MDVQKTKLQDVYILCPKVFGDARGWFTETWSLKAMQQAGLNYDFVQENQSFSAQKGTLRGLHLQKGEMSQAKLVRCLKGAVLDVAVDLREGSPSYLQWVGVELSQENKRQLLIPRGFAHGFLTLSDDVEFFYKVDNPYAPETEQGIAWNDPQLAVDWGISAPILSQKDAEAPTYARSGVHFMYDEVAK